MSTASVLNTTVKLMATVDEVCLREAEARSLAKQEFTGKAKRQP